MFGTKVLRVGGIGMAIADINILDDEVSIRDIKTDPSARGQGYAKRLVDNLFEEFPDEKIVITDTTEDGAGFFEKNYDIDENQRIYPKGTKPGPALPVDEPAAVKPAEPRLEALPILPTPSAEPETWRGASGATFTSGAGCSRSERHVPAWPETVHAR